MLPFSSFQELAQFSGNCISLPIEIFKTENCCKALKIVDATNGTQDTRKRGLRTPNETKNCQVSLYCHFIKIVKGSGTSF